MRGEINRLRSVCAEAYQVVGTLAAELDLLHSKEVERVLDNLYAASAGEPIPHKSVLPFILPNKRSKRRREGCREEVLAAAKRLHAAGHAEFTPVEIIEQMQRSGTAYPEQTIRTHVVSRMCANAPQNHATQYDDLERVAPGRYRLRRRS